MLFAKAQVKPGIKSVPIGGREIDDVVEAAESHPARGEGGVEVTVEVGAVPTINGVSGVFHPHAASPRLIDPGGADHVPDHLPVISSDDASGAHPMNRRSLPGLLHLEASLCRVSEPFR